MSISRRTFLRRSMATAAGLGLASPLLKASAAFGAPGDSGKIVVLVNLYGGNDFLNTVVPLGQFDRYRAVRPNVHITQDRALPLPGRSDLGLNPGLAALHGLYQQNKLAVVVGAGAPPGASGLFDHEASQFNLQAGSTSGSAFTGAPSGWLGRYLDSVSQEFLPPAVNVGYSSLALTGQSRDALTLYSTDSFGVFPGFDTEARLAAYQRIQNSSRLSQAPAAHGRAMRQQVLDISGTLRERTESYQPAAAYPEENYLAYTLYQCAQLIEADLGVRALAVGFDGFDTHANQNDGAQGDQFGYHDYLLHSVSEAVSAFHQDVVAHGHGDKVLILINSEFGRRAFENTDLGTDHGFAGGMFVLGDMVRGGVYGDYPSLADNHLVFDGNIDVTVDFRQVYATVLADYLGADPAPILGGNWSGMGFVRG